MDFLPIGSIIKLDNADQEFMITGYIALDDENKNIYDYCGCLYPLGVIDSNKNFLFDRDKITEVVFKGYESDKSKEMLTDLKEKYTKEKKQEILDNIK